MYKKQEPLAAALKDIDKLFLGLKQAKGAVRIYLKFSVS